MQIELKILQSKMQHLGDFFVYDSMEEVLIKEVVTAKEAFTLESLGFNEPCFGYYMMNEEKELAGYDKSDPTAYDFNLTAVEKRRIFLYKLAPTYSQALKWFIKKHNIQATVFPFTTLDKHNCYLSSIYINFVSAGDEYKNRFDTPEEAERYCLEKLIEIVKNR